MYKIKTYLFITNKSTIREMYEINCDGKTK